MTHPLLLALTIVVTTALMGCSSATKIAPGITPVENFDSERYLGTWYVIARMDQFFARGLYNVTATYTMNDDGSIKVENRGYKLEDGVWKSATGNARFVGDERTGHLKVSFFGPFYASYVVFDLSEDYQHAFVAGSNQEILWLLARTPEISDELLARFTSEADSLGYDINELIFDVQNDNLPR